MDNNLENEQNKIFFGRLKKKNGMGSSQIMNEKNLEPQKGLGGPQFNYPHENSRLSSNLSFNLLFNEITNRGG